MNTIPQNLTRAQRISSIIEQRQPLVKEIQRVETHLREVSSAISHLENYRKRLEVSVNEAEVKKKLHNLNFYHLIQLIQQEYKKLGILKERLSCSTLNIGVIGLMGQGKSTLLKSLSGLTDQEIPALEGGACTAVRSTIENLQEKRSPEPSSSKKITQSNGFGPNLYGIQEQIYLPKLDVTTKAEVTLHSEDSFLREVIWPYYDELGFTDKPDNLNAFAEQQFSAQSNRSAADEDIYQRLRHDYHLTLDKYRHLLKPGVPQKLSIQVEEISEYVIQKRDGTMRNNLTSFKHLAVREVKIFCPFKNPDVGKISLVDLPGLGDSKLGDEQLMLETLGKKVDIVLFIKRPDPQRYQWQSSDIQLYDKAAQALNDLEKRSFMVLNYSTRTENIKACEVLKQNLGTIKVAHTEIVDCADSEDANRVFNLVIDYLTVKIKELDKRYASSCQNRLRTLHSQINTELEKARSTLTQYSSDSRQFRSLFDQLSQELISSLVALRNQLKEQCEQVDPDFEAAVQIALQNCENDRGIPLDDEEIKNRSYEFEFKESYQAIYRIYIRELRIHLSRHFLQVDKGLRKSIDKVKSAVVDVLVNHGRLGELIATKDAVFLKDMADLLAERGNQLELGFRTLWEFEFSYGSSLLHLVRKHLDEILQSDITDNTSENQDFPPEPSNATEVRDNLEILYRKAVDNCQETLKQWLQAPSQARYYMVQEFIDLVIYAKGMKKEWEILLNEQDVRSKVWPEFRTIEKRKQDQQDWRNTVERIAALNQLSAMLFIN
ncbi:dynamin family protein [Lyngbya aestuarii]|uniref:dynamin family protein n=1 Tax=Lyngbya aestuarii TaxID=118322 RepID=UPI00403D9C40